MRTVIRVVTILALLLVVVPQASAERGYAQIKTVPTARRVAAGQAAAFVVQYDGSDVTEGLRGYHIELSWDDAIAFVGDVEVDVVEGDFLSNVGSTAFFAVDTQPGSIVIDGAILGATVGAFGIGELFTITFTGQDVGDGVTLVEFTDMVLRDQDNMPILSSGIPGIIELDNTPPNVPVIDPEPEFTQGTTNYITWSNESASGAAGYCVEASETPDFAVIVSTSGCTPFTWHTFTTLTDGQIYYYRVKCRDDLWNESDWSATESSTQDDSPPVTAAGPLPAYVNSVTFNVPFTEYDATSGTDFVWLYYRFNGGAYVQYGGVHQTSPISFTGSGEGVYDFYTVGVDNVTNIEATPPVPDATVEVDLQPPDAVTDLEALPGHNRIHLSWNAPMFRSAPVEGTLIVRKRWAIGAYPEYDDVVPQNAYPAHPADGVVVAFVPGTGFQTYDDESFSDAVRNIYLYTAFARDEAGNYSAAVASAQDRSTSYWLGDVDEVTSASGVYDGYVDYWDKIILSDSYNTTDGDAYYEPEMDIGPTDDWSRFGIPLTDSAIDFEDLMVVAMNYGRVDPAGKAVAHVPAGMGSRGSLELRLDVAGIGEETAVDGDCGTVSGPFEVALSLCGGFDARGFSSIATFDADVLTVRSVEPSGDAASGDGFFYWTEREPGVVQIDIAVLGEAAALTPDEFLATLTFEIIGAGSTTVEIEAERLRGVANERLVCGGDAVDLVAPYAPDSRTVLHQNIPNPFNPRTTIAFELAVRGSAKLTVFDATGRRITELINGEFDAGRRAVVWDGSDARGRAVGSGVYFYVLETEGKRHERKMVLMR